MKKLITRILQHIKHTLLKTSLEQWLTFGLKSEMPQKQIVVVYAGYSLLGTLLLALPFASNGDVHIVDHLFTVVSAFSTTGLSTIDVATEYTFFGQFIILTLIQMGSHLLAKSRRYPCYQYNFCSQNSLFKITGKDTQKFDSSCLLHG